MNIKQIAKAANVSTTTVSRVLNNSGYVSAATKRRVLDVIAKANYIPSGIARSLSKSDSNNIGVIIPDITNEFFASMIKGIEMIAKTHNYNIVLFDSNESVDMELSALEIVESQRMSGLIITPVNENSPKTARYLNRLENNNTPVVLVDRELKGSNVDGIFVDNISSSREAVNHFLNNGHQKIAIITGPETSLPGKNRLKGYLQALQNHNIPVRQEYVVSGDFKIDSAYSRTEELLNLADPPTAIFSSNNQTTLGALKSLIYHRHIIGETISLIGFDQIEALRIINYQLSTIDRDVELQGVEAMNLLAQKLNDRSLRSTGQKLYIPYKIVLRGSEKIHPDRLAID